MSVIYQKLAEIFESERLEVLHCHPFEFLAERVKVTFNTNFFQGNIIGLKYSQVFLYFSDLVC